MKCPDCGEDTLVWLPRDDAQDWPDALYCENGCFHVEELEASRVAAQVLRKAILE